MTKIYRGGNPKWRWQSWLSYVTQNLFPFVSFDKEGIINVFTKTVLPWFLIFTMIEGKFHFSPTFSSNLFFWARNTNYIYVYMLFAGWEVRMVKNISRTRSEFFSIRTDPKPVNNMFFFLNLTKFFPKEPEWLRAVNMARSFINWTIFERVNGS